MSESEYSEVAAGLTWTPPDPTKRGTLQAEYQGHRIVIMPVGAFEYDYIIDEQYRFAGNDEFEDTAEMAKLSVDKLVETGQPLRPSFSGVRVVPAT